jgi:hypothetical protein
MDRSEPRLGQPGATWGNLKTEVAPDFVVCLQGFYEKWGNRGNLFVSLTCGGRKRCVFPIYRRSRQKVAQVAPVCWKWPIGEGLERGNLKNEVAPGCPGWSRRGGL